MSEDTKFFALLTGSNSGLGLSIAHRILDEFLRTHPPTHHLTLILTTRSAAKGAATLTALTKHLVSLPPNLNPTSRITLTHYTVDLTNLLSVATLSSALLRNYQKLDYLLLNAGMGAFTGIAWCSAITTILTGWVHAVTYPSFKLQALGWTTKQPAPLEGELGSVWCANVFGHYYLSAELMPLLAKGKGRIVWTSSLEAYSWTLDAGSDLQCVKASHSYEATRRLTDILSLTSTLPSTDPYTSSFFSGADAVPGGKRPKSYVTHPGICATAIVPLNIVLWWCMVCAFWVARFLGSPWHTISTYSGAAAAVWLVMASDEELEEKKAERVKWGSSVVWSGEEGVKETEVEGEGGEGWEDGGRVCWRGMEEARKEWKGRVEKVRKEGGR